VSDVLAQLVEVIIYKLASVLSVCLCVCVCGC